jgi:hypothetical protein
MIHFIHAKRTVIASLTRNPLIIVKHLELTQEVQPGWYAQKAAPMGLEQLSAYMFRALNAII